MFHKLLIRVLRRTAFAVLVGGLMSAQATQKAPEQSPAKGIQKGNAKEATSDPTKSHPIACSSGKGTICWNNSKR
jgi:hypothetical protein